MALTGKSTPSDVGAVGEMVKKLLGGVKLVQERGAAHAGLQGGRSHRCSRHDIGWFGGVWWSGEVYRSIDTAKGQSKVLGNRRNRRSRLAGEEASDEEMAKTSKYVVCAREQLRLLIRFGG